MHFALIIWTCFMLSSEGIAQKSELDTTYIQTNEYAISYGALTATPYTIPKGSLVYQNLGFTINTLEYGVTDRFSVAAGAPLFNFGITDGPIGFLFLKYNFFKTEGFALSASNLNIFHTDNYESKLDVLSIMYLNTAIGSKNKFVTLGAGFYFPDGEQNAIYTLGYHNKFSDKMAFIADLWIPVQNSSAIPLPAAGIRLYLDDGFTIDLGFPFIGFKAPLIRAKDKTAAR